MSGRLHEAGASPDAKVPELGFRRVTAVRVWAGTEPVRYEIDGVVHRRPVTQPVTAGLAARLVAAGVPLVTRRSGGTSERARW